MALSKDVFVVGTLQMLKGTDEKVCEEEIRFKMYGYQSNHLPQTPDVGASHSLNIAEKKNQPSIAGR